MKFWHVCLLAGSLFVLAGCGAKSESPAAAAPAVQTNSALSADTNGAAGAPNERTFLVRGTVKSVEPDNKTVTIAHEQIPNYMEAMTMPFRVKDPKDLEGVQAGDTIWFRLWVTDKESWIDKIKKEDSPQPQASTPATPETFRVVKDVPPLDVGDKIPDYRFTNELGQALSLSDFKGQALAFTFIYTRCPLPDFCPRMSKNFAEVSQKLAQISNGPTNWHLLSISFDPTFDTPTVLNGYAQAFGNNPKHWNFVTGSMTNIDAITDQLNLTIEKDGLQWNHKLRTVVIDTHGRVQRIFFGNEWTPDALVEEIVKAANPTNSPLSRLSQGKGI